MRFGIGIVAMCFAAAVGSYILFQSVSAQSIYGAGESAKTARDLTSIMDRQRDIAARVVSLARIREDRAAAKNLPQEVGQCIELTGEAANKQTADQQSRYEATMEQQRMSIGADRYDTEMAFHERLKLSQSNDETKQIMEQYSAARAQLKTQRKDGHLQPDSPQSPNRR